MPLRLWQRLFLAFALLCGVTLVGFVLWQQASFREGFAFYLDSVARQRLEAAATQLAQNYRENHGWAFLHNNPSTFEHLIDPFAERHRPRTMSDGPPPDFNPGSPPGSAPPPGGGPEAGRPPPDGGPFEDLRGPPGPPNRFDLPSRVELVDAKDVHIAGNPALGEVKTEIPVKVDDVVVGTLRLASPPPMFGGIDLAFASKQKEAALRAGVVALVAALLLAFALARWMLRPVRALTRGMHALTAGDFAQRVRVHGKDELGALARDFNHLAQTLEQHREARRRWGADIAHELRTPLSVLRGEISALQDGVRPATPAAFDSLAAEGARLSGLIEDLYQLSLADAGALEYRFETLDFADFVHDTVELHRSTCVKAGLALETSLPDEPLFIRGDTRRLGQLIDNLLANARRYTDPPGRIRVSIAAGKTRVRLMVDDSPPGVPDADLPHLFERLYRVEGSRNRAGGGAGLGLAICKAIVEAHDAQIQALASPLGGLRIAIDFRLAAEATG